MLRRFALAAAVAGLPMVEIAAQTPVEAVVVWAPIIGYGVLSVSAVKTLINLPHSAPATPGSTVRLRSPQSPNGVVGRVVRIDESALTLETVADTIRVARSDVVELEVNVGTRGRWAQGWGFGLLIGAAGGVALGLSSGDDDPGDFFSLSASEKAVVGAIGLGVLGSSAGALLGLAAPDRWVPATSDQPNRVTVAPILGSRVGVVARVAF